MPSMGSSDTSAGAQLCNSMLPLPGCPPSYAPQMSGEGTETSKQALHQESPGGERVSTTTPYITTQRTPAQVQNEAQPMQEQREVSGQGLGVLRKHARNRI
ncbi:hypothetical protein MRX96_045220 [Rhipicephalus microplus]